MTIKMSELFGFSINKTMVHNGDLSRRETDLICQAVDAYDANQQEISVLKIDLRKTKEFNCGLANENDEQQQEIAELKLALVDLNKHDDEITSIENTNQELSTLVDARINKLVDENNELKAQVSGLVNVLSGARKAHLAPHTYYCKVNSILNKTPAECLQSVRADEIDRVKNEITVASYNAELDQDDIISYLDEESTRVREGKS